MLEFSIDASVPVRMLNVDSVVSPRVNKFVFIGKDLNKDELREEFQSCIVGTDGYKELRAALEEEWANEDDDTQEGDEDDEYVPYVQSFEKYCGGEMIEA